MSATADQQLLYETRVRNRQAVVAVVAGVLLVVASIFSLSGPHTSVNELTTDLLFANRRFPLDLIASIVNGVAALGIAWTLVFLYGSAKARNDQIRGFIRPLVLAAGGFTAIAGVAYGIIISVKVHQFASTGAQTYQEANALTSGAGLLLLQVLGQFAALLTAVAFVLVSLQAMRVGLLTKFMGYLGMLAGALVLFQITQVPVVQLFWLAAVGYLISGRWPTGVPAAWRTGRAEAWPSAADLRAQRVAEQGGKSGGQRGARNAPAARQPRARAGGAATQNRPAGLGGLLSAFTGRAGAAAPSEPADAASNGDGEAAADGPEARTRASTPKRKRKRRR